MLNGQILVNWKIFTKKVSHCVKNETLCKRKRSREKEELGEVLGGGVHHEGKENKAKVAH